MPQRKRTDLEEMLDDYYSMKEREKRGSLSNVISRLCLEEALKTDAMTPRERMALALRWFCCLEQHETAQLLGLTQQAVSDRLDKCLVGLLGALTDTYTPRPQKVWKKDRTFIHPEFDMWAISVLHNIGEWWNVPRPVRKFILSHFGTEGGTIEHDDYERERPYKIPQTNTYKGRDVTMREKNATVYADVNTVVARQNRVRAHNKRDWIPPNQVRLPHDQHIRREPNRGGEPFEYATV